MVELFKTLGDLNRLRLVNLLMEAEICVCEIEVILELTQSNASRHLRKLREAGLIRSSKEGQWIHYRFAGDFDEAHPELIAYLRRRFGADAVYREDLARLERYRAQGMSCTVIRQDRAQVMDLLR